MAGHLQWGILPRAASMEQDTEINHLTTTKLGSEAEVYLDQRTEDVPEQVASGLGPGVVLPLSCSKLDELPLHCNFRILLL